MIQERRSPEPMISLELWGRRPIAAVNGASLLAGMVMIGLTTFLPVFVQGVMQKSPLDRRLRPVGDGARLADRRDALGVRFLERFGVRAVLRAGRRC